MLLLLSSLCAAGWARADGMPSAECEPGRPCVRALDARELAGSPCRGTSAQLFLSRSRKLAALQCVTARGAAEPSVLVFSRARPLGAVVRLDAVRVLVTLQGLADPGTSDAGAPLCARSRAVLTARPDLRPDGLTLLTRPPGDDADARTGAPCVDLLLSRALPVGAVVRLADGMPLPGLPPSQRSEWQPLLLRLAAPMR